MIRRIVFLLLVVSIPLFSQTDDRIIHGELLVRLEPNESIEDFTREMQSLKINAKRLLSKSLNIWLVEYDNNINATEALYSVMDNDRVKVVQHNHTIQRRLGVQEKTIENLMLSTTFPDDPSFGQQWGLNNTGQTGGVADADIDAPEAWDFATGGTSAQGDEVVVAIVDGGFDLNHEDIVYWKNMLEIPGNGIDDDGNGYIDDYDGWNAYTHSGNITSDSHGTHVAGIAAAHGNNSKGVSGVNWGVKVMPVQGSSSNEATVVEAYSYILEMRTTYNETDGAEGAFIVSTNASFGVDFGDPANYPLWCGIYDDLGEAGILSCGATANLNIDVDVQGDVPTACPSEYMIAVTNTTSSDNKNSGAAYGATTIDLGAPGTSIYATLPGNSYGNLTGTSMATPHVAGAIGLIVSAANNALMQAYKNNPAATALLFRDHLFDGVDPIASLDGITVTGGRLNVYNSVLLVSTPPDNVPPTTITDLTVTDVSSNGYKLTWTAPLDTSRNGVVGYDIRRSNNPITNDTQFDNAEQIPFGTPAEAGQSEELVIDGMDFNDTKYYAIKAFDTFGNISAMSNVVEGTTLSAPSMSVAPQQITHTADEGETFSDAINIENDATAPSTLDYEVSLNNHTFPMGVVRAKLTPKVNSWLNKTSSSKDNTEPIGGQTINGLGGPDGYGYIWKDSEESDGPEYVWNDISDVGVEINFPNGNQDDGHTNYINLGFSFNYYGTTYNNVKISSNGFVSFANIINSYRNNTQIPDNGDPNGIIAVFWDDLLGTDQGSFYYLAEAGKFTVQWEDLQKYYSAAQGGSRGHYTFQLVLEESGRIKIYYKEMDGETNSGTVGIESPSGDMGLQVAYNSSYPPSDGTALQFMEEPEWMEVTDLGGGRLYNGNNADIELDFNTTGLPPGEYSMDITITSNAPEKTEVVVPVTLTVNDPVPVELTSFSADVVGEGEVVLSWVTASETNNKGFEVEKRQNSEEERWKVIGYVEGGGTKSEESNYRYEDKGMKGGKVSYRLKQIDYDGTYSYSEELEVEIIPVHYKLEQNYPNPFNPRTTIRYALPGRSNVKLSVYNTLGEVVSELVNGIEEAGYYEVEWRAENISSGLYIYVMEAESEGSSFRDVKKML
ncbi:MAG: S8 family serine peptidase, partial [Melioribacteraceae bacterium]|nr:S8 family serine peptidase [Melioribacteraceae bacterium]